MTTENKTNLIRMSDVELQRVEWLRYPYIMLQNQDCNIANRSRCNLEDGSGWKIAVNILCIVAFFFSAVHERTERAVCALRSGENAVHAEVFGADLRQENRRLKERVFRTSTVFTKNSDFPFPYSPLGECKHRI